MKRFQVVIDLSKQLISIAVGLIGGSVALSSNIFSELNQLRVFLPFIFALLCWGISIALGVFNIGATVNQIEQQEKCDYKNNKTKKKKHLEFVSIFDSVAGPKLSMLQQILFVFGLVAFCLAFILDKITC